jgi:hypothetical protein
MLTALISHIFNRNKVGSESAKLDAEAQTTTMESYIRGSEHLLNRLRLLEAVDLERERELQGTQRRHRKLETHWGKMDLAYRNRSHEVRNEWTRLILRVRELESRCEEEPMRLKTLDQIDREFPLPKFPDLD